MKKYLERLLRIVACILVLINLCGCWSAKELNTLAVVMGIAIDKIQRIDDEEVKVTIQLFKPSEAKGATTESGASSSSFGGYSNVHSKGSTIADAMKGFNRILSRRLFLSDNQVIVFSDDIAMEGLKKYIDYLLRNRETRLLVWVFVAEGDASKIFNTEPGFQRLQSRRISELSRLQEKISQSSQVDLRKFISRMMSKTTAPIAPIIRITEDENNNVAYLSETAVFKKDKMVGKLNETETKGLLFGIDEIKGSTIIVNSPEEKKKVSLNITDSKCKITPQIYGDEINIKMEIKEKGDLDEETSSEDLVNPKAFEQLQIAKANAIKDQVLATFKKSKELNADIFGLGDIIYKFYPSIWKELEEKWDDIYKDINLDVTVECKLQRSGRITKPILLE